jgi:AcrR family transcriptional regulator
LIRVAEQLMAEHGIEGVELTEIQRLAGQRNRSAIAYHFVDRDGLVRAIGVKHRERINQVRNGVLDRLERRNAVSISTLADALVRPLGESLSTPSGRDYIVILAEAASRLGSIDLFRADGRYTDSVVRIADHLMRLLPGSTSARRETIGRAILVTPVLLADVARDIRRGRLTEAQGKRRLGSIVHFVASALHGRDESV